MSTHTIIVRNWWCNIYECANHWARISNRPSVFRKHDSILIRPATKPILYFFCFQVSASHYLWWRCCSPGPSIQLVTNYCAVNFGVYTQHLCGVIMLTYVDTYHWWPHPFRVGRTANSARWGVASSGIVVCGVLDEFIDWFLERTFTCIMLYELDGIGSFNTMAIQFLCFICFIATYIVSYLKFKKVL